MLFANVNLLDVSNMWSLIKIFFINYFRNVTFIGCSCRIVKQWSETLISNKVYNIISLNLPPVVKISTSHKDKDPSTPTNWRKTYWPVNSLAHVKVFVTPSSEEREQKFACTCIKVRNIAIIIVLTSNICLCYCTVEWVLFLCWLKRPLIHNITI